MDWGCDSTDNALRARLPNVVIMGGGAGSEPATAGGPDRP